MDHIETADIRARVVAVLDDMGKGIGPDHLGQAVGQAYDVLVSNGYRVTAHRLMQQWLMGDQELRTTKTLIASAAFLLAAREQS